MDLPASATEKARERNFEIAGYAIDASSEALRAPRVVRVGLIQNKIVLPTTDPVLKQVDCDFEFIIFNLFIIPSIIYIIIGLLPQMYKYCI